MRRFDLRSQDHVLGDCPIPAHDLARSSGELIFSDEVDETFHVAAPPEKVPGDIWRRVAELIMAASHVPETAGVDMQSRPRPTLQVVELVRIPHTKLQYRFADQEYEVYIYDIEGREKFYAEHFPVRWDRIERLFRAISNDLLMPNQSSSSPPDESIQHTSTPMVYQLQCDPKPAPRNLASGYRIPVEVPPYSVTEDGDDLNNASDHQPSGNK